MIRRRFKPVTRESRFIVYLWLIYNTLDVISTELGLRAGFQEMNWFKSTLMAQYGPEVAYGLKMFLALLLISIILLFGRRLGYLWHFLRGANVLVCLVVLWNIVMVIR